MLWTKTEAADESTGLDKSTRRGIKQGQLQVFSTRKLEDLALTSLNPSHVIAVADCQTMTSELPCQPDGLVEQLFCLILYPYPFAVSPRTREQNVTLTGGLWLPVFFLPSCLLEFLTKGRGVLRWSLSSRWLG